MRLLKAKRRLAGLGGLEFEWPTRNVGDPQRSLELEAGQPFQVLGVPFPQLRVLGLLAGDGVLHDGVAEMIHHRRDGEDAAQPLVQTFSLFSAVGCLAWAYALSAPAKATGAGSAPALQPRFVL